MPRTAASGQLPAGYGAGSGFCGSVSGSNNGASVSGYNIGASFDNVYACGPVLGTWWSNDLLEGDFQCVELSLRFLWDAYGLRPGSANGANLVSQVHAQYPSIPIDYPGVGQLPAPGDVVSLSGGPNADPDGHTAVVTGVSVDTSGNGEIGLMEQNGASNGWDQINVSSWNETFGSPSYANGYYYYPNVSWLALTSPVGGLHFAPVDTGFDAAIAVSDSATTVRLSSKTAFGAKQTWSSTPFYGSRATLFADLDGPLKPASAVAINDNDTWVMKNQGSSFGPPQQWSSTAFYGTRATLMADVDGSGRASAVAINDDSIWVMPNMGDHFGPPQLWAQTPFYGSRLTTLAVIDGSHRASAVAINDSDIWVMQNNGAGFNAPTEWGSALFYGSRGTYLADLDGSGIASAVAMNDSDIWVERNTGNGFGPPTAWASGAFWGTWQYLADVDGSGRASAIAVSPWGIWVRQNTGGAFGTPTEWLSSAFFGDH
ncbi:MAG: CHAP domain-containing protein [Candidatus Dormibacteraeota bacterium]|nr:CHAP domain-containing protein [Candidatus Dormibacteraeota bacterium]